MRSGSHGNGDVIMSKIRENKRAVIILACVVIIAALAVYFLNAGPATIDDGDVPLRGAVTELEVKAGDKFVVSIIADGFEDMYGYEFKVYYDDEDFTYSGGLTSSISSIGTIFAKNFEGYERVGATMVGDAAGVSGDATEVCRMVFEALRDCTVNAEELSFGDIRIVTSDGLSDELGYETDVSGWIYSLSPYEGNG